MWGTGRPPPALFWVAMCPRCVCGKFFAAVALACPNSNNIPAATIVISDKGPLWIKTGENSETAVAVEGKDRWNSSEGSCVVWRKVSARVQRPRILWGRVVKDIGRKKGVAVVRRFLSRTLICQGTRLGNERDAACLRVAGWTRVNSSFDRYP